jgi:heptosyltransferase-2
VLEPLGLEAGGYWAIAPGAEYGPSKRWPTTHVAALASRLAARDGRPVLLLGSPGERPLCEAIAADTLGGTCIVLAGRTSLGEAIALVSRASGFVSNDSGLMHVAAALGVPQVAVFGSTSPLHTPPRSARARVVWLKHELGLECMPCFERTCRLVHHRCMTAIAPERVGTALAETVAAGV